MSDTGYPPNANGGNGRAQEQQPTLGNPTVNSIPTRTLGISGQVAPVAWVQAQNVAATARAPLSYAVYHPIQSLQFHQQVGQAHHLAPQQIRPTPALPRAQMKPEAVNPGARVGHSLQPTRRNLAPATGIAPKQIYHPTPSANPGLAPGTVATVAPRNYGHTAGQESMLFASLQGRGGGTAATSRAVAQVVSKQPPPLPRTAHPKPVHHDPMPAPRPQRVVNVKASTRTQPIEPAAKANKMKKNRTKAFGEVVTKYVRLPEIEDKAVELQPLRGVEIRELEAALQLDRNDPDEYWRSDWLGNLMLIQKNISNPISGKKKPSASELTQPLWEWASTSSTSQRLARNLICHVYYQANVPPTAKKILAQICPHFGDEKSETKDVFEELKRLSYDPVVLEEDGWTVGKGDDWEGSSGGPAHIGTKVLWQKYEAVVIAYIHDDEIGDLWKAMWLDGFETFDMEAGELQDAKKKYERKHKAQNDRKRSVDDYSRSVLEGPMSKSARFEKVANFRVDGIEHGIILASTYNSLARPGVFWPARVMHASELTQESKLTNKRNSSKGRISVVFLAPYWNTKSSVNSTDPKAKPPLLELDSVEVSPETIQKYPYSASQGLSLARAKNAFRFTGLPKKDFTRFVQSHRMALALRTYAETELETADPNKATAGLLDTHLLAVQTARFPKAVLHLPFEHIMGKLPALTQDAGTRNDQDEDVNEPVVSLKSIVAAMEPPKCFGYDASPAAIRTTGNGSHSTFEGAPSKLLARKIEMNVMSEGIGVENFAKEQLIRELDELYSTEAASSNLKEDLARLVQRIYQVLPHGKQAAQGGSQRVKSIMFEILRLKGHGEDALVMDRPYLANVEFTVKEWKRCCERMFKFLSINASTTGDGRTLIQTDSRCNEHITKFDCVERPVRLPAALRGCKMAGVGSSDAFHMETSIEDEYFVMAENGVLPLAHSTIYLKKMKAKCHRLSPTDVGQPLTDDSDGGGNGDTTGARGTFTAALAGVAAALKATKIIVGGGCVNAFCATRPPGHHAGRDLHPMDAVSNGFCILNPVACAALYATMPNAQGGLGLRRVCIVDFDVHHGNGTQDILCNTYDPRFFYVSLHAGGAQINGYDESEQNEDNDFRACSNSGDGIFPGRCGDTSPHEGVLNIPLGSRVAAHDVGSALLERVEPAVLNFSPDLIILSAGFDAHKNDPLGLGGLSSSDFGHITDVICDLASRCCSSRVLSVLEGGYGVPCCRLQKEIFLPSPNKVSVDKDSSRGDEISQPTNAPPQKKKQQSTRIQPTLMQGLDLPESMDDQVTPGMQKKLEKCHQEGFIECVMEHVQSLKKNNSRS